MNFFNLIQFMPLIQYNPIHVCIVDFEQVRVNWVNTNLFKVNNTNSRKRCEICSKLAIKTPEKRQRRRSGVFIVILNKSHTFF